MELVRVRSQDWLGLVVRVSSQDWLGLVVRVRIGQGQQLGLVRVMNLKVDEMDGVSQGQQLGLVRVSSQDWLGLVVSCLLQRQWLGLVVSCLLQRQGQQLAVSFSQPASVFSLMTETRDKPRGTHRTEMNRKLTLLNKPTKPRRCLSALRELIGKTNEWLLDPLPASSHFLLPVTSPPSSHPCILHP